MLELFKSLVEKAGVSNSPEWIQLAASPELQALKNLTVAPEIEKALNSNLISVEAAKSHKDVINHIKGLELGKVDLATKKTLTELGLTESEITEIMSVGTTDTKVAEAIKRINKLQEKQGKSGNADKEKVLSDQIAALTAKLQSDVAAEQSKYSDLQSQFENFKQKSAISKALSKFDLRDDLSREDLELLIEADLNKFLSTKGAKIKLDNNGLELRDAENLDIPFLDKDQGKQVKFDEAFAKILAENKRLKVSKTEAPTQGSAQSAPAKAKPTINPGLSQLIAADLVQ